MAKNDDKAARITIVLTVTAAPFVYDSFRTGADIYTGVFPVLWLALAGLVAVSWCRNRVWRLSVTDIFVAAYLLYGVLNVLLTAGRGADGLLWWKWAAAAGLYCLARAAGGEKAIPAGLVLSGAVQSVVVLAQYTGMIDSRHLLFGVTGSFGNPGPLGGFMAVCMVAAISLAVGAGKRRKYACIAVAVAMAAALWMADSRAALVAVAAGAAYVWRRPISAAFRARRYLLPATIVAACASAVLLTSYRPLSAQARLGVWNVTGKMIVQKPIFGHGAGNFPREYMIRQADYFAAHPDSPMAAVADNTMYAYNEILHLGAEQGAVGLILLAAILVSIFRGRSRRAGGDGAGAALAALFCFSLFSYPTNVFPIFILFPVLMGAADRSAAVCRFRPGRAGVAAVCAAAVLLAAVSVRDMSFYRRCLASPQLSTARFERAKYCQALNSVVLSSALGSGDHEFIVAHRGDFTPYCETYCHIGDACRALGMQVEAEQYYRLAADMVPTRIRPNYELWKLFRARGEELQAREFARKILSQPLKVDNTYTMRVRREVEEYCRD